MSNDTPAYGLWGLVLINSAVFIIFAFSFAKPATKRDWRSFSAFSAFVVALFAEMYGFPLTIYLLSGWLQSRYPKLNVFSHESGHLWQSLLGFKGDPHLNPIHLLSNVLIAAGFILLASAWRVLYAAQREHSLAVAGPYTHIRHPQYVAFIMIMLGFLLQWPTILTLVMFPILVTMHVKLAHREEREAADTFGDAWNSYAACTPAFVPHLGRRPKESSLS
jgi:protein-S-isoprenylcysteine O-methyltransferase Ste14